MDRAPKTSTRAICSAKSTMRLTVVAVWPARGDAEFGPHEADVRLLRSIAQVTSVALSPFVAAPSPTMFGRTTYSELAECRDLSQVFEVPAFAAWNAFRDSEESRMWPWCCRRS